MRSDLLRIDTKEMPKSEWLRHQLLRTGGSSAAVLMGLNEYMSSLELFYLYIGQIPQKQVDNAPMFFGRLLEDYVAMLWTYWEGSVESMMRNHDAGKQVQFYQKVEAILVNPDYPHLHANLDGEILSTYSGRKGVLEIKTISSFSANKWQAGLPISYVIQAHVYMIVTGYDYAEIACLKDGREFEVFPIEFNADIANEIIKRSVAFWERVNEAKEINNSDLDSETKATLISELEPEADSTVAYESFLRERYRGDNQLPAIDGTQEQWTWAMELETEIKPQLKVLQSREQTLKNQLISSFKDFTEISFDAAGKITYRPNKVGNRTLRISLK